MGIYKQDFADITTMSKFKNYSFVIKVNSSIRLQVSLSTYLHLKLVTVLMCQYILREKTYLI